MDYNQLRYTHSFNSNELLGNSNCLGIHTPCIIIVLYYSFFIDYTELLLPSQHHFANFMHIVYILCETVFLVPRPL